MYSSKRVISRYIQSNWLPCHFAQFVKGDVQTLLMNQVKTERGKWDLQLAVDNYLLYLAEKRGLAESTIFHYGHDLQLFRRFLERVLRSPARHVHPSFITPRLVEAFLNHHERRRKNSPSSTRRRLAAIRGFQRFLEKEGLIPPRDHLAIALPAEDKAPPNILEDHEAIAFIQAARTAAPNPLRDHAVMLLLLTCGPSQSELLNLTVGDFDLGRGLVRFRHKPECDRFVKLPSETHRAVIKYIADRPSSPIPQIFLNRWYEPITKGAVHNSLTRCLAVAGIRRTVSTKDLRNTYIYRLVDEDRYSNQQICKMAGLRSTASLLPFHKLREKRRKRN